ncbi:permease [Zunongwangia sp. SCSIO 43204]|uniref:permease n=1 Tax=Zunongwangia sp. SCSIO 43204 TaxID=2779359 RepID=UPI001CA8A370|nr:permease [Zunongwangia sp. SCSIO 43204]UAB83386.1 permease [Zunongwangia sp. SCSIO 43204]
MDVSLQKTITFILFIGIGLLLKVKFSTKAEVVGIKKIILNLALPATIFIALLGIKVEADLLLLPLMALILNALLFYVFPLLLPILGIEKETPNYRTAKMLIPSLAPGLSCFPFVLEYLGDSYLAKAAMADLGNKVFVLMILYVVAMNWHYKVQKKKAQSGKAKLKSLGIAMISEPVNVFIAAALLLVGFGLNLDSLPFFASETLSRLSLLMTPLVLLYIGLAVNIKKDQLIQILGVLMLRAGFVILITGLLVMFAGISIQNDILLMLAFGLSACSFWPFAHISAVDAAEVDVEKKTFNPNFAVSILALSFPLSTILILGILSSGNIFAELTNIFLLGGILTIAGFGLPFFLQKKVKTTEKEELLNEKMEVSTSETS